MKRIVCAMSVVILFFGCQSTNVDIRGGSFAGDDDTVPKAVGFAGQVHKMKFGPPPPGYVKIVGEAVPQWQPEDMTAGPRGPRSPLSWYPLGPRPILDEGWSGDDDASGRVVSVAPHPIDPDIAYIASASGGVWKTTNGGALWTPLTDELSILNHGCVTVDPSNPQTVYAGTGEYTTWSAGDGLFRSTDGGTTWIRIATTAQVGSTCSRVVVDPTDSLVIHVTGEAGYHRSDDGGAAWTTYLAGTRCSDVALNPSDPSTVYVARHGDGIYKSTNGGDTFNKLAGGLPTSDVNRILLAVAPSEPSTIYTAIINGSGGLRGLYKTTNGGTNWTQKSNTPDFPYPQGWYDVFLGVDPTNEDIVYGGGVFPSYAVAGVVKSTNGGNNWTDITIAGGVQLHPDQHAIAFGPDGTIWIGNDGGVWKSIDSGASWINTNATLTVTQNYNIAIHPTDPAQAMGGTQDNGTVGRESDTEEWPQVIGGDGGFLAYDANDPIRKYTTYVYLSIFRFDPGFSDITGPWGGDPANFIAPLVMDPNDPHTLLGGTNRVWRTTNAHSSADWTTISTTAVAGGGTLNAIAVAPSASDMIYTGSTTGKVYRKTNALMWDDISSGLPGGQVSDIVIDPIDPETAYATFYNTSGARVLRKDPAMAWADVTGDLPSGVAARALAVDWRFDPPHLHIGSGAGVYSSSDGGTTWAKDGLDLPNVNIGDLVIDTTQHTITVGTYGRGAWRAVLPSSTCALLGDVNDDGHVNGADIAGYVRVKLGSPGVDDVVSCADYGTGNLTDDTVLFVADLLD